MTNKITGNPEIVATNGTYDILKRGSYYGLLKKGQSIYDIKKWRGEELLHSRLIKGGYTEVDPPKPYKE